MIDEQMAEYVINDALEDVIMLYRKYNTGK